MTATAIWSVVRGESPTAHAVEPGPTGITIPDAVLEWAADHGLTENDTDVYLLVTPADEAGIVDGEIAYTEQPVTEADLATLREALSEI